jgi:thiamine biosynthesis lipoprotein
VAARAEILMGTTVAIEAAGADADTAIDSAFAWFQHVEHVCTRFDPASELRRLAARPGEAVPVSRLLFEAVRFALHVAHASQGAFDPTIGALMQDRGFDREHRSGTIAPPLGIDPAESVTYRDVAIDPDGQTITLRQPLLLDLGAVAKGLAIDLAARVLEPCGSFAIDAGGDLYLGGLNPDGQPWSIGIRDPRRPGECLAAVRVSNQAVCTSGDYERVIGPPEGGHHTGTGEHHIVDPRSGASPRELASVTVLAPSAMAADALATAAFVLGIQEGLALVAHMGLDALMVTRDGGLRQTPHWPGVVPAPAARTHA